MYVLFTINLQKKSIEVIIHYLDYITQALKMITLDCLLLLLFWHLQFFFEFYNCIIGASCEGK
jgi:hypothetical protein